MYRERAKGWLKHVDFIVLDIVCLQVSFALAYVARHGWRDPYRVPLYRGMAFALLMIGVAVIFFANVYSGVLKRGWFREGTKTLYETGLIVGLSFTCTLRVLCSLSSATKRLRSVPAA